MAVPSTHRTDSGIDEDDVRLAAAPRTFKVLGLTFPAYRTPIAQVVLMGFICFMCPGMFNALNGMGGGGQIDGSVNAKTQTALYSTFAVFGFTAGTFLNYFGARSTLAFGGIGYSVYAASYLSYNHTANVGFCIFAGTFLGFCAALLWCAQGTVMMSYPTESEKGRYIGLFWAIFNSGGVIGSLIPLATNWNTTENTPVKDGTYVGFLVLMLVGAALACLLVPPSKIVRNDGSRVQRVHHPSIVTEMLGLWETIWSDSYILLLFPFFWASNWFYTYQQNAYNLYTFNTRSRAFTGLFYWLAQIIGSVAFGYFLDNQRMTRRSRAIWGWVLLFVVANAIWGGGLKAELGISRPPADVKPEDWFRGMDVFDKDFTWYMLLYMFYGVLDAIWQTFAYWLMGALSNDPRKLAYFAGFYKGIQSAGAAVIWGLDTDGVPFRAMFGSSWGLCLAGLFCAVPVIYMRVHDTEMSADDYIDAPGVLAVAKADATMAPTQAEEAGVVMSQEQQQEKGVVGGVEERH
ncbi:major facilitator superfamily domain-containing protein [Geopyxis carbonaria]|nr:major facilitator superfamily domain-containing protein [Geopyxis carbonaria]